MFSVKTDFFIAFTVTPCITLEQTTETTFQFPSEGYNPKMIHSMPLVYYTIEAETIHLFSNHLLRESFDGLCDSEM